MDGAQLASMPISQHKARTSARHRREAVAFENAMQKFDFNDTLTLDDAIASRGGIPLVEAQADRRDRLLGRNRIAGRSRAQAAARTIK
jgi:uncharacterized protein GlcG (DUF336 family)